MENKYRKNQDPETELRNLKMMLEARKFSNPDRLVDLVFRINELERELGIKRKGDSWFF